MYKRKWNLLQGMSKRKTNPTGPCSPPKLTKSIFSDETNKTFEKKSIVDAERASGVSKNFISQEHSNILLRDIPIDNSKIKADAKYKPLLCTTSVPVCHSPVTAPGSSKFHLSGKASPHSWKNWSREGVQRQKLSSELSLPSEVALPRPSSSTNASAKVTRIEIQSGSGKVEIIAPPSSRSSIAAGTRQKPTFWSKEEGKVDTIN